MMMGQRYTFPLTSSTVTSSRLSASHDVDTTQSSSRSPIAAQTIRLLAADLMRAEQRFVRESRDDGEAHLQVYHRRRMQRLIIAPSLPSLLEGAAPSRRRK